MSDPQDWSPEEQSLHRAMHEAADDIMPTAGGLAAIRKRTSRAAWWRRPALVGVGVATATAVGAIAVALVVTQPDDGAPVGSATTTSEAPSPSPSPSTPTPDDRTPKSTDSTPPSTSPPSSGTAEPESEPEATSLPVYFAVETSPGEPKLVREWHQTETADPVADAVRTMLGNAQDADYRTLWLTSTQVQSATIQDDEIIVDLSTPGLSTESQAADATAIQQLVYTATAAASSAELAKRALPVRILENGEPMSTLGSTNISGAETRADDIDVLHRVRIDEPLDRSSVSNPVTVRGAAAVFEATVEWEVRDESGEVVESDFATADVGAPEFGEYSFDVPDLDPGRYEVEVRESDASGGEGGPPPFDTKTFTIPE